MKYTPETLFCNMPKDDPVYDPPRAVFTEVAEAALACSEDEVTLTLEEAFDRIYLNLSKG